MENYSIVYDEGLLISKWREFLTGKFEKNLETLKQKVQKFGPYKMFIKGEYEELCYIADRLIDIAEMDENAIFMDISRNMRKCVDGLYNALR